MYLYIYLAGCLNSLELRSDLVWEMTVTAKNKSKKIYIYVLLMKNVLKAKIHKSSTSLLVAILGMNRLCSHKTYYKGLKKHLSSNFLSF